MKNVFLTSALVLCSVAGFAQFLPVQSSSWGGGSGYSGGLIINFIPSPPVQNVATTTQNGTSQTAITSQSGTGLTGTISQVGTATTNKNNEGGILQTGTGHTATINQNGTLPNGSMYNRAYATQLNGNSPTGANSATISQSNGSGGAAARGGDRSIVTGDLGNWAGTYQTGGGNQATVMQDGPGSKANLGEITQRGTGNTATSTQSNGAVSNLSQIFQGYNLADVSSNTATVNQDGGQRNEALVNQFSDGNKATVLQNTSNSMDNKAFVTQGDGTNVAGQAGNTATVTQTGTSTSNTATVAQTGSQGDATVRQKDGSLNNIAFINQVVGRSSATINQTGYGGAAKENTANVTQYGDYHIGVITQDNAIGNTALIRQGGANTATSNNGRAFINQVSGVTNSTATINQNQTVTGSGNKGQIDQTGSFGQQQAIISQEGSSNVAGLIQTGGNSNTATVSQTGNFNTVGGPGMTTEYNSLPANSYALQNGTGNSMVVMQTSTGANTSDTLNNMASLSQTGMGNTIALDQTLTSAAIGGNMSTISQAGTSNMATVTQTGGSLVK